MPWQNLSQLEPRNFTCGYCGSRTGNDRGFLHPQRPAWRIFLCPSCDKPSFFDNDEKQTPGPPFGNTVAHLPEEISKLYDEARDSKKAGAPTSAVLTCRKILMNVSVALGADPGQSFVAYVEYLASENYLPPNAKGWVDFHTSSFERSEP